jgi:hypothetical protein
MLLSDLEWGDPMPGLHEIVVVNLMRRSARFFRKKAGAKTA